MKKIIMILLMFLNTIIWAHKNKTISQDFGNIKVIYTASFFYEEMNKALIIGQYSEELSKEIGFKNKITLFFKHQNLDGGKMFFEVSKNTKDQNSILIELKGNGFKVNTILNLVKYSISNFEEINKKTNINDELLNKNSSIVNSILEEKKYRANFIKELKNSNNLVSYYYQNDSFYIYRCENKEEKILMKLNNIYQFSELDEYSFLIFDSKESFFYVSGTKYKQDLKRSFIKNVKNHNIPYVANRISNALIAITFFKLNSKEDERVVIYNQEKNESIQDLRSLTN